MGIDEYFKLGVIYQESYKKFIYLIGLMICLTVSFFIDNDTGFLGWFGYGAVGGLFLSGSIDFIVSETIETMIDKVNVVFIIGYFASSVFYVLYLCFKYSGTEYPKTYLDYYIILILASIFSMFGSVLLGVTFKRFVITKH